MIRNLSNGKIITGNDAFDILKKLQTQYQSSVVNIALTNLCPPSFGVSAGDVPGNIIIGVQGLENNTLPVSEKKFMFALVAFFHEIRHADQYYDIRFQDTELGHQIAVSQKAFVANPEYSEENYYNNPCEIDAERSGIFEAYLFCVNAFGMEKANSLVCKYVNYSVKHNVSFVKTDAKYNDIKDILMDYDDAYQKSVNCLRKYDLDKGLKKYDSLAQFLVKYPHYKKRFDDIVDGQLQDEQVAAIAVQWSGYSSDGISILESLNLLSINKEMQPYREIPELDYSDDKEFQGEKQ